MVRYGKHRNPDGRTRELVVMNRKRVRFDDIVRVLPVLWERSDKHREGGGGGGIVLEASGGVPSTAQGQISSSIASPTRGRRPSPDSPGVGHLQTRTRDGRP